MKYNVENRSSSVRGFQAGGRFLTLAGGERERGVELSKDEADALIATGEFGVVSIESDAPPKASPKPAAEPQPFAPAPAKPVSN